MSATDDTGRWVPVSVAGANVQPAATHEQELLAALAALQAWRAAAAFALMVPSAADVLHFALGSPAAAATVTCQSTRHECSSAMALLAVAAEAADQLSWYDQLRQHQQQRCQVHRPLTPASGLKLLLAWWPGVGAVLAA